MDSQYVAHTAAMAGAHFWTSAQPVTSLSQAPWPCVLTSPWELAAPGPFYPGNFTGAVSQLTPRFYKTAAADPNPNLNLNPDECRRMFFLDRSLYELVAAHSYLALTDPRLLSWYLSLSPEDRKIIQDEGGLHRFLQRHPALELSKQHVYMNRMSELDVTTLHSTIRTKGAQQPPHEQINRSRQLVHLQDCFQTALISPIKQECEGSEYDSTTVESTEPQDGAEEQSANVCTFMEDVCAPTVGLISQSSSSPITSLDQSDFRRNAEERSTPSVPCSPTCDVMVGTEPEPRVSALTQTEDPKTADKDVNTDVYMTDLDNLAVEVLKLRTAQDKLKDKEEMKSAGCKVRCDCVQRAQRAELSLLTLQYSVCRQHCLLLYYTTAMGAQLNPVSGDVNQYWLNEPPVGILSVLQKLESDYNELSGMIRKGVPLEKLKPLSVDSEKIIGNLYESVLSRCPQELHTLGASVDDGCERKTHEVEENRPAKRAATLLPQGGGAVHDAGKPAESQTATCTELTASESWYDAEENLERAEPTASVHSDGMLSSEKCSAPEGSISPSDNDWSGHQSAEAVGREVNGSSVREHVDGAVGGWASASASSQDATKPHTLKAGTSSTEVKLTTQPPPFGCSIRNRQVVCMTPTMKGTCVPQHYATMGGLETLMAELSQRHPDVGRQMLVDALVELRTKPCGVLAGLPLSSVGVMVSELLTRPCGSETPESAAGEF